jgi:CRISPR-associated protein Csc1
VAQAIRLFERGVRVFAGRLYNHDYLWFSSNEISKVSTTRPFLHNYALSYAVSQRSYRVCVGSVPKYIEAPDAEFNAMPVYCTPAHAASVEHTTITFNALDDLTLTTGDSKGMNTPNLGRRSYLNLIWEPPNKKKPSLGYEFYVFTFNDYALPGAFRLGKKGAPVRVRWQELPRATAFFRERGERPSHVINPLDVNGRLASYDPIAIPPHMLLRTATIEEDWFVFGEDHGKHHAVQVPKRVLARIGVGQ